MARAWKKAIPAALALGCGGLSLRDAAASPPEPDLPVAPRPAVAFEGWAEAYCLTNEDLQVVAVPAAGRIVFLGLPGGSNLLRAAAPPASTGTEAAAWQNLGGDWLWPVAQSRWPLFQESEWPPGPLLAGPWSGHAWVTADGSQCCLMTREFGAPLHLKVTRLLKLPAGHGPLQVKQRAERLAPSLIPASLWSLCQVRNPDAIVLPMGAPHQEADVPRSLLFGPPPAEGLARCAGAAVLDAPHAGEVKLCSPSARGWIAARHGDLVVLVRVICGESEGAYPDGGCALETYVNAGLGYAELETLSPERELQPGEAVQNTLEITLRPLPEPAEKPCDLVRTLEMWLGEFQEPAVPPAE